jgi:hypothetical protein
MTDKHNGFDAALRTLRWNASVSHPPVLEEYEAAIRVLEAAGKLLRVTENGVLTLDTFWEVFVKATDNQLGKKGSAFQIRYEAIRALIESLPDAKEEKR